MARKRKISSCSSDSDTLQGGSVNGAAEFQVDNGYGEEVNIVYEFNIDQQYVGLFIGVKGKSIREFKHQSGAQITLRDQYPFEEEIKTVSIEGTQVEVDNALQLIRKKFPKKRFPKFKMEQANIPLQLPLPVIPTSPLPLAEGVSVEVYVSCVLGAGHIFVQQPTHPTYPQLHELTHSMNACYCYPTEEIPGLKEPVSPGALCAVQTENGWMRAMAVTYYKERHEVDVRFADYGGYRTLPVTQLKSLRSDFLSLPYQACECYVAHLVPLDGKEFTVEAATLMGELTFGNMLQALIVGRSPDTIPHVELFRQDGPSIVMINRVMSEKGVVKWAEKL